MKTFSRSWLLLACVTGAYAADWPMWRYDAARSAASPDGIATNLTLLWSRKLAPPRQAWPLEVHQRLNFDASYEPVVMGQLLFLGSQNDGSVTAYDTTTGEERWKFYTEGPVRCASACWRGKVYTGSDDGYLYCLDAQTGKVVWKFRGAPSDRPDKRQLGNGHLVSFWPVRGGPVVADGVVYFGAGIWPTFGVFLHALEAETGKVYGFVGHNGVVSLLDLRETASLWTGRGGTPPPGYTNPRNTADHKTPFDLWESPYLPYKISEGCETPVPWNPCQTFTGVDASSAFDGGVG